MNNKKVEIGLLIAALIACFGQENTYASQASNRRSRQQNISIWKAAETGDLAAVKRLIRSNRSLVNKPGGLSERPLNLAAEKNHYPVVKFLLEQGADVDAYDGEAFTPLGYATLLNHGRLARYLMDHWQANITLPQLNGSTVLHLAAGSGNIRLVKTLIQRGLAVNATNDHGETPLHDAVLRSKDAEVVEFLIKCGANVHARDKRGNTPLLYALSPIILPLSPAEIESRNIAIFNLLLTHGADVNAVNNEQQTTLGLLLKNNQMRAAKYLADRGA